MQIRSYRQAPVSPRARPVSRPAESSAPRDTVELKGQVPAPDGQGLAAAAASALAPGPASLALREVLEQATHQGIAYECLGFLNLWWRDATADKAAELLEHGQSSQVKARRAGQDLPLEVLTTPGPQPAEQRLGLYDQARQLSGKPLAAFKRLYATGYASPEKREALGRLAEDLDPWQATGTWGAERLQGEGLVWSDSPGARYKDNQDTSLTRRLKLEGMHGARLEFRSKCDTEKGADTVSVQLRREGQEQWTTLDTTTGRHDWTPHSFDLSAYDGQTVELRFRLHTDGSVNADGFSVTDLKLSDAQGKRLFLDAHHDHRNPERLLQVAEQASLPQLNDCLALHRELGDMAAALILWPSVKGMADRSQAVASALAMGSALGDRPAGALLWQGLAPFARQPDLAVRQRLLTGMAAELGADKALVRWTQLTPGPGSIQDKVELERVARTLFPGQNLYSRLARAGLVDHQSVTDLQTVARHLAPWTPAGSWGTEPVAGHGLVWTESPNGRYKDNLDISLTRPLILAGLKHCHLKFEACCDTENGNDRCLVEISRDGRHYDQVGELTGRTDWSDQDLDLSAYDGQAAQLRFRFLSDQNVEGDGVKLAGMRLVSDAGSVSLQPQYDEADGQRLLGEVTDAGLDQAGRRARLASLAAATAALGDARAALQLREQLEARPEDLPRVARFAELLHQPREAAALWPLLQPLADSPDFSHYRDLLVELAREGGVDKARQSWKEFSPGQRASTGDRVELLRTSRALATCLGPEPTPQQERGVFDRLAAAGLDDEASLEALSALSRHLQPWRAQGDWGPERVPEVGLTWSASPGKQYSDNYHGSLTRWLSLRGMHQSRLEFRAASRMEKGPDTCNVQVSRNGEQWFTLASFTGKSDWKAQSLDLSAFDGQNVQLRFAFSSDQSVHGDGFWFAGLKAVDSEKGACELQPQFESADLDRVIDFVTTAGTGDDCRRRLALLDGATRALGDAVAALEVVPGLEQRTAAQQTRDLKCLDTLNQTVGAPREVARLWSELAPYRDDPDFDQVASVAANLVVEKGLEGGLNVWKSIPLGGAGGMGSKLELLNTSRALAGTGLPAAEIYQKLHGAGLYDAESVAGLNFLARHMQAWRPEGQWGHERVPGVGTVWSDSPGEAYRPDQNASLTRPLSLVGVKHSKLVFSRAVSLESADPTYLEVSRNGREWVALKQYTGNSDWQTDQVDLSDYDGQQIQMRFRFTSDQSVQYDGFKLHDLALEGQDTKVGLQGSFGPQDTRDLLNALADRSTARARLASVVEATRVLGDGRAALDLLPLLEGRDRATVLGEIKRLDQNLGDARGAVRLWSAVADRPSAERRAFGAMLVGCASQQGVEQALKLWSSIDLSGQGTPDQRAGLFGLAHSIEPDQAARLYKRLQEAGLWKTESQHRLARLLRQASPWQTAGTWGTEHIPGRGTVWSDSPGSSYADNRHDQMTRRLSLAGLTHSSLAFDVRYKLENSDQTTLAVSPDGKQWTPLASFSGEHDWESHSFDLSKFDGREVLLRFGFDSDQSVHYDGISYAGLRLEGQDGSEAVVDPIDGQFAQGDLQKMIEAVAVPEQGPELLRALDEAAEVAGGLQRVVPLLGVLSQLAGRDPASRRAGLKAMAVLSTGLDDQAAAEAWAGVSDLPADEMLEAAVHKALGGRLGDELSGAGLAPVDLEQIWTAVRDTDPDRDVRDRLDALARDASASSSDRGKLFRELSLLDPKLRARVETLLVERNGLGATTVATFLESLVVNGLAGSDPEAALSTALEQATADGTIEVDDGQVWVGGQALPIADF